MTRALRFLVVGLALALAAAPLAAQIVVEPAQRGWLGVSFEVRTSSDGTTTQTTTRVTDVMPGSPAAEAGVRAGDVLISFNGQDWTRQYAGVGRLRPGDPVRLVVERNGRRQEIRMTAGTRPREAVTITAVPSVVAPDSIVERLFLAMDSLRVRILEDEGFRYRIGDVRVERDSLTGSRSVVHLRRTSPDLDVVLAPFDLPVLEGIPGLSGPEVRPPFGFYLFRGPASDSLARAMNELNDAIRTLRARHAARTRELTAAARNRLSRIGEDDPQLVQIDEELARLGTRADELKRAMEETSRGQAEGVPVVAFDWTSDPEDTVTVYRPLAPYLLGQNRVAGAEVVDLRPELAEYFQVEGGILVVNVPDRTPASEAGIQPGDVLTHMDGSPLRSIEDLRRGLVRAADELPVTLVRKGRAIQVLLKR